MQNAAKKAGRIAAEGLSYAYISEDNSVAVAVEVNSETDFVAKNEKFQNFVKEVAQHVVTNNCANVDEFLASPWGGEFATVQDALNDMISVIGEKLSIRRLKSTLTMVILSMFLISMQVVRLLLSLNLLLILRMLL